MKVGGEVEVKGKMCKNYRKKQMLTTKNASKRDRIPQCLSHCRLVTLALCCLPGNTGTVSSGNSDCVVWEQWHSFVW